ncbi:MAG: hypothetical protein IJE61_03195 [Bacteroidales bacterium]|nr:hypothetical protein [Bacteroidales bacterium]
MNIGLYTLTSPLHNEAAVNASSAEFISSIEAGMICRFDFKGPDFSDYGTHDLDIIFVRTGGTEGLFKEVLDKMEGPIRILTSGKSNSLAASMEILSYLNLHGHTGEIIHGSISYITERINTLARVQEARNRLHGCRLGIIGAPSDWLISSVADRPAYAQKLGIELLDIPINDIITEYHKASAEDLSGEAAAAREAFEAHAPQALHQYINGAVRIYKALKSIIRRHKLSGLTIRCFDLLDSIGNTGCLALAILNAEGFPAGCEGDVPTLMTMAIGNALTGVSGFQANPSRIDPETGEMLLAHCTIPLNMVTKYGFNTHFESGIGVAICGEMPLGDATVLKVSGDLTRVFCCEAELLENRSEKDLCRTQTVLRIKGNGAERKAVCSEYFLKNPIGNHHVVFPGSHKDLFEAFCQF